MFYFRKLAAPVDHFQFSAFADEDSDFGLVFARILCYDFYHCHCILSKAEHRSEPFVAHFTELNKFAKAKSNPCLGLCIAVRENQQNAA